MSTVASSSTLRMAVAGARAHRGGLAGTFLVLALAGALLSITGVLFESGARGGGRAGAADTATLSAVAGSFGGTAITVVVLVVASTVALALRQRRRELALLRAIGATKRQIRRLIGAELALIAAVAAPLGAVPALFVARRLTPLLIDGGVVSPGFHLAVSPLPVLGAIATLVPVALLAAALATRETLRTPPTEAVRESTVEPRAIGRARRLTAAALAVGGLASAGNPLVVPGVVGSASAATSAFLLVGAAAVAGPLLIGWCLDRASVLERLTRGASSTLAIANTRGFSRRLTTAIVPLALALTAGTVQSSTDQAVTRAARAQLAAGLHADTVVTAHGPAAPALTAAQVAAVARVPGVAHAVPVARASAAVDVDGWEPTAVTVVAGSDARSVYDLGIVDGSLADLSKPDTVAASTDALFASGIHVGDRVRIRLGGTETSLRLVATYDRGLGFGDLFADTGTMAAHGVHEKADSVLVQSTPGAGEQVREALRTSGFTAFDRAAYASAATTSAAGEQRLSFVLLLALLAFIVLAAANTLVMTTASRRAEIALLRRTGATRRQLLAMGTWEAAIAGTTAWVIATLASIPAVIGVDLGLLGPSLPFVDLRTYAALSLVVAAVAVLATVPPLAWQLRQRVARPAG